MPMLLTMVGLVGVGLAIGLGTGENKKVYGDFALKLLIASMFISVIGIGLLDAGRAGG